MAVLFFAAEDEGGGSRYIRCELPAKYLNKAGIHTEVTFVPPLYRERYKLFDRFVFERPFTKEAFELVEAFVEAGKTCFIEMDDDFVNLPAYAPAAVIFAQEPWRKRYLLELMGKVKAVICTTEGLAEAYGSYAKKVEVIENCIEPEKWVVERPHREHRVIGYSGAYFRSEDLQQITWLAKDSPWSWTIIGSKVLAEKFNLNWVCGKPIGEYQETLREIDIGVVPLAKNRFNDSKSDLKGLEFAASGIPFIASPSAEYLKHWPEVVAKKPKDWEAMLARLVEDGAWYEKQAQMAKLKAQKRDMKFQIQKYLDLLGGEVCQSNQLTCSTNFR